MEVQPKKPGLPKEVTKGTPARRPIHLPLDPRNNQTNIATAAHPPLSHHCHRSRLETRCDRLSYTCNWRDSAEKDTPILSFDGPWLFEGEGKFPGDGRRQRRRPRRVHKSRGHPPRPDGQRPLTPHPRLRLSPGRRSAPGSDDPITSRALPSPV